MKFRFIGFHLKVVFVLFLFLSTVLSGCKNRFDQDEENRQAEAKKGRGEISFENGEAVLTLDSSTQNRLGLEVVTLTPTITRQQITAPAVVLSTQDLATFRNTYLAAQAQLEKSRIEVGVARKEYTRLKTLFDENQNISEKSLQSAEGILQANEADVRAGEQQLRVQESVARQEWGGVVAGWAVDNSSQIQSVFDLREMFVQVTLPAGAAVESAKAITLEIPGSARMEATFVSPFPRVDPRVQGRSFLYLASARSGLSPGVNLVAHLSVGNQLRGVVVPTSAVVWSEGKAWVYQQTAPERFARRAVSTDTSVEKGFVVTTGLTAGAKVVTQGAQALLSEELLLHGQQGAEPDVD